MSRLYISAAMTRRISKILKLDWKTCGFFSLLKEWELCVGWCNCLCGSGFLPVACQFAVERFLLLKTTDSHSLFF